ncbi:MAG: DUF4846 domain-containing protein [Bacteroidota bacterium]
MNLRPALALIGLLFIGGCAPNSESRPGDELPIAADFVQKTPQMPTTFVDTTGGTYAWHKFYNIVNGLENRIKIPPGFRREPVAEGSFGAWLRGIPLKPGRPEVLLYNGARKGNQEAHYAVIDIDVGKRDLQQCADAVMRLRAEYLYTAGRNQDIHFRFTSGDNCEWDRWRLGYRPRIQGNRVSWNKSQDESASYPNFRAYLNMVFNYAGTASLAKELRPVISPTDLASGDVFIRGGFPGHAVLVMDVAINPKSGQKVFLLAQSYMPAQEMHLLRNPTDAQLSPWYPAEFVGDLLTPEWTFARDELRRFAEDQD